MGGAWSGWGKKGRENEIGEGWLEIGANRA